MTLRRSHCKTKWGFAVSFFAKQSQHVLVSSITSSELLCSFDNSKILSVGDVLLSVNGRATPSSFSASSDKCCSTENKTWSKVIQYIQSVLCLDIVVLRYLPAQEKASSFAADPSMSSQLKRTKKVGANTTACAIAYEILHRDSVLPVESLSTKSHKLIISPTNSSSPHQQLKVHHSFSRSLPLIEDPALAAVLTSHAKNKKQQQHKINNKDLKLFHLLNYDPEDANGMRARLFINPAMDHDFKSWLQNRKKVWRRRWNIPVNFQKLPKGSLNEDEIIYCSDDEMFDNECDNPNREFWKKLGDKNNCSEESYPTFHHWLRSRQKQWTQKYSWNMQKRLKLQTKCDSVVHLQGYHQQQQNQGGVNNEELFHSWLEVRKNQWKLLRRKRHRRLEQEHLLLKRTDANISATTSYVSSKDTSFTATHNNAGTIDNDVAPSAAPLPTAASTENWIQCDKCQKWRVIPKEKGLTLDTNALPEQWYCEMNVHDLNRNTCLAPEQTMEELQHTLLSNKNNNDDLGMTNMPTANTILSHDSTLSSILVQEVQFSPKQRRKVKRVGEKQKQNQKLPKKVKKDISTNKNKKMFLCSDTLMQRIPPTVNDQISIIAVQPVPCSTRSLPSSLTTAEVVHMDAILEEQEQKELAEQKNKILPIFDLARVLDSRLGIPDDIVTHMFQYLSVTSQLNTLKQLSKSITKFVRARQSVWRQLCPPHWILPKRPRKSWCDIYVEKTRLDYMESSKQSDDVLNNAAEVILKGDQVFKFQSIVKRAVDKFGFQINYTSGVVQERNSLLNLASISGRAKIVKWLLEKKKANIETVDRGNFTPLINAAWAGDRHLVRFLLSKGANRSKLGFGHSSKALAHPDFKGLTAEGWARKRGNSNLGDLIQLGLS
eukprot:CAMPEP_0194387726 /NCGR_PEP_ID=MMETSP0174-20130528/94105_1 /TAXON_ID=216777 /ORGANISM="Proboscia alata, Strain PI-D3" /LENGTH=885 /DNA_ID=CAMNT_0039178235 /DNA_START=1067 /DNA_END=3724 /DNA_ORIENTATION=-